MKKTGFEIWTCPEVDMYTDAKGERVMTEVMLPGVKKKDIKLETGDEGFCIESKRGDVHFDSCYRFSERVEPQKIRATFENGLLEISAPVSKSALHARRVAIH